MRNDSRRHTRRAFDRDRSHRNAHRCQKKWPQVKAAARARGRLQFFGLADRRCSKERERLRTTASGKQTRGAARSSPTTRKPSKRQQKTLPVALFECSRMPRTHAGWQMFCLVHSQRLQSRGRPVDRLKNGARSPSPSFLRSISEQASGATIRPS